MTVHFRAKVGMGSGIALGLACCFGIATLAQGQTPATPPPPDKNKPADQQKPAPKPADSNAFPEDTGNVPVLPTNNAPVAPDAAPNAAPGPVPALPGDEVDPVRSPDDPPPDNAIGSSDSSSSAVPMDRIAPPPDTDTKSRRKGKNEPEPEHQETAKEDESVGGYYLSTKNWKAALSRFESAVVLDPENPDVYWGLAEAQRHLEQFAEAKSNYQKVMEYDPDSKHAKEAKKLLAEPEMAKAK